MPTRVKRALWFGLAGLIATGIALGRRLPVVAGRAGTGRERSPCRPDRPGAIAAGAAKVAGPGGRRGALLASGLRRGGRPCRFGAGGLGGDPARLIAVCQCELCAGRGWRWNEVGSRRWKRC